MSTTELPALTPGANPEFRDSRGCAEWLQRLPLTNVSPSHAAVLGQLEELNGCDIVPAERLRILELLREPATFLQEEHAKKYTPKPVPLARQERDVWHAVVALWEAMLHGYERCLEALREGAPELSENGALLCQRALWCVGRRLAEHHHAYQEALGDEWGALNRIYRIAEALGVADQAVAHPTRREDTTCTEAYLHVLLAHLANPNEQSTRQMALVSRWLEQWVHQVRIGREPPEKDAGVAAFAVDTGGAHGAAREPMRGEAVRFLDLEELGKSLRARLARLSQGESPQSVGLGEDVAAPVAEQMLATLHRQWCEHHASRAHPRRPAASYAMFTTGIAATHYFITGTPFRQPPQVRGLSRIEHDEIATFGRVSRHKEEIYSSLHGFALEQWEIQEESLSGMRIRRLENGGAGRFTHNQLVALQPTDAKAFLVGVIRWLGVSLDRELRLGLRLMPGVPQGVAVRPTGLNVASDKFIPALALTGVPALSARPSLIVPAGWYRAKRVIEVYSDKPEKILLHELLERGGDFERVTFGPA